MIRNVTNDVRIIKYPCIEKIEGELNQEQILKFIRDNAVNEIKYKNNQNYYISLNAGKTQAEPDAPNNCVNIPYGRTMVTTVKGYMYRPGLIRYSISEKSSQEYFDKLMYIYRKNHEDLKNSELGECQSKYGIGFEMLYLKTEESGETIPYFYCIDPAEVIPIFENTIYKDIQAAIRYYVMDKDEVTQIENKRIEVYYKDQTVVYEYQDNKSKTNELKEVDRYTNYFKQVPLIMYYNNNEIMADYECVKTMIDLYDQLLSDAANELNRFAAAYLILKNYILGGDNESAKQNLDKLKQMRVFEIGQDGEITFLTKDIPTAFFTELKSMLREDISYHSNIPDFRDKEFGTSSGVAIKYKMINFENLCADKEAYFKVGLEKRKELIDNILKIKNINSEENDIIITFTRNVPANIQEVSTYINQLKSSDLPISDKTLLSQVPFIEDVNKEIEQYKAEQEEKKALFDVDTFTQDTEETDNTDEEVIDKDVETDEEMDDDKQQG